MDLMQKLREQGWYLTEEGIKKLPEDVDKSDPRKVIQAVMDMDFREIAGGALPSEISKKDESISGKIVLQVVKIRNISAPKANEESKVSPRFLQIDFTDGVNQVTGLEFEHISTLSLNTPPGTKVYLKSEKIPLMQGFLVLRPSDIQFLGGKVLVLVEKWEMSRTLQKYAKEGRVMAGSSGPPPWIPFGQKIQQSFSSDKDFKSLSSGKDKEGKENNEFETMRSEAIAEAAKAGGKKVFGGGNQQILDHNVKKIIERGFTEEEAKNALKATRNNLERALYNLKRREEFKSKDDSKSRISTMKKNAKDLKKSKDDTMLPTKPAGNVSLFDFLTDKLSISTEPNEKSMPTKPERSSKASSEPAKSYSNMPSSSYNNQQHRPNHNQSYQQQPTNNPNQANRPKFENNISSSFASRSNNLAMDSEKNRNRNARNSGNASGSYNNRQDDISEKSRNNNYNRHQRPMERNSNYHSGTSNQSSILYESRNRNEYQQKNGYDKYAKGSSTSRYPSKSDANTYQANNRNYSENRQVSHNNDANKINKIIEDTSKMKIDNKSRASTSQRSNQNVSVSQHQQQPHHQQMGVSSQQQQQQPQQSQQQQQQQVSIPHTSYSQLPNGFAYDPSKIIGFQNKETNEFAMTMLKNQALNASLPPQPPPVTPHTAYPPPSLQIPPQHPSYATAPFVMQQAHPPPPSAYSINPGESWNWKVGDRCLAKYWDDGRFYEAEITGLSDKTCVVLYLGYGNHEEVLKSDCLPITDVQHRPINFSKMHEMHNQPPPPPQPQQQSLNRSLSNRFRGERQMYVPPPKREA